MLACLKLCAETAESKGMVASPKQSSPLSLYERLGGEGALQAAVGLFYDKVIADPLLAPFFEELDMPAQVRKQLAFMANAFGGPAEYRGRDVRSAHQRLVRRGLSDAHFDAVAGHLRATLQELEISQDLIEECLGLVASLRNEVLDR